MQLSTVEVKQINIIHPTWLDYIVDLDSKLKLTNLKKGFFDQIKLTDTYKQTNKLVGSIPVYLKTNNFLYHQKKKKKKNQ